MCKVLDFDSFLAVVMKNHAMVSFEELISSMDKLKSRHPDLVINTSTASVEFALQRYAKVFAMDRNNKCFIRATNSEEYYDSQYIEEEFTSWIPQDVLNGITEIFSKKELAR